VERVATSARAALIYRLSGDRNPLHTHHDIARQAGFNRPILHGLASYGTACAVVLRRFCGGEPVRIASLSLRFAGIVFTLEFRCWSAGDRVLFEARVGERTVLDQCAAVIA
jgi:acyl dehydratase